MTKNRFQVAISRGYLRAGVGVSMLFGSVGAFAQSDPFATAVAAAEAKVDTYGAALVGLAAVAVLFFIAIKYVKKISHAA